MLDEPVNGLDPEGIHWIRHLLKGLAAEGRTVFVSSHLMGEMALTADHLIVVGRGRLVADTTVDEFISRVSADVVEVRSPDAAKLARLVAPHATKIELGHAGLLEVHGLPAPRVGEIAAANGIVLHALTPQQASLEEAFMALTRDEVEFRTQAESEEVAA